MSKKTNITYIPDLNYKKSFDTLGNNELYQSFEQFSDTVNSSSSIIIAKVDIINRIYDIRRLFINLPGEIVSILNTMLAGMQYSLDYIDNNNLPNKDDSNNNTNNSIDNINSNDNQDSDDFTNGSGLGHDDSLKVDVNYGSDTSNNDKYSKYKDRFGKLVAHINGKSVHLPSGLIKKSNIIKYSVASESKNYDLVDAFDYTILLLYNEYLDKIQTSIINYNLNISEGASYGNIFDMSSSIDKHSLNVDLDKRHLLDNIIRNDIIYDQKVRLSKKLYTLDNCINHFNSLFSSKVFYNRYKSEKKQHGKTLIDRFSNHSLTAAKTSYYNKYMSNLENIYKYYNSCAVILGECLNTKAQSFVSKNIIG